MTSLFRRLFGAPRAGATCVYTCLIGGYEPLNEQPVARDSKIPFICLTDDADLRSETWQIVRVEPLFPMDPIRSQRMLKILPQRFLPGFDVSLYIDNSVVLSRPPEEIIDRYLSSSDFALPTHSFRDTVLDEFLVIARTSWDDPVRVFEHLNHLALTNPDILLERPYWTGLLMRRHRANKVQAALDLWAAHVQRYSRRDQLSVNMAFDVAGLKPRRIEIDDHSSWFHTWPHIGDRDRNRGMRRPGGSLAPVIATLQTLEGGHRAVFEKIVSEQRRSSAIDERAVTRPARQTGEGTPGATFVTCANGRTIHVDPGDNRGEQLIKSGGDLNPPTLAIWRLLLAECHWTHVIDVGASYGEMLVGADIPPAAAVVACEPNPYILPYLYQTIRESGRNITVVAKAVSSEPGTADLIVDRTWSGLSSMTGRLRPEATNHVVEVIEVPTTTVAALVETAASGKAVRVLVKVDVEGHEAAVLQGARALVERAERFTALVEILHASDRVLDWLLANFAVELYDLRAAALVRIDARQASELRDAIASNRYYRQDAVLRRRT